MCGSKFLTKSRMTELEFNPASLPSLETLIYHPNVWGLAGELKFHLKKNTTDIEIKGDMRLGFKLFIQKAFLAEAVCSWVRENEKWQLTHFLHQVTPFEEKKEFKGDSNFFDPISLAYCLRANPIRRIGDLRTAKLLQLKGESHISIKAVAEKQQELPAFGPGSRKLFEVQIAPTEKSHKNFGKDVQVWIDADTNIVAEASIRIPIFGRAGVRLVKLTN